MFRAAQKIVSCTRERFEALDLEFPVAPQKLHPDVGRLGSREAHNSFIAGQKHGIALSTSEKFHIAVHLAIVALKRQIDLSKHVMHIRSGVSRNCAENEN